MLRSLTTLREILRQRSRFSSSFSSFCTSATMTATTTKCSISRSFSHPLCSHRFVKQHSFSCVFLSPWCSLTALRSQKRVTEAKTIYEDCLIQGESLATPTLRDEHHTRVMRCIEGIGKCWFLLSDFQVRFCVAFSYLSHVLSPLRSHSHSLHRLREPRSFSLARCACLPHSSSSSRHPLQPMCVLQ